MIGNFVSNLRNKLNGSSRVSDVSMINGRRRNLGYSTDESPSFLNKILNASYALVSQQQDDAYCSENLFMLPRVYSHGDNGNDNNIIEPCRSPISLQAPEKTLDELDNIVDKFVRCISIDSGGYGGTYNGNV